MFSEANLASGAELSVAFFPLFVFALAEAERSCVEIVRYSSVSLDFCIRFCSLTLGTLKKMCILSATKSVLYLKQHFFQ